MIKEFITSAALSCSAGNTDAVEIRFKLHTDYNDNPVCFYSHAYDYNCGWSMQYVPCGNIPDGHKWCADSKYDYSDDFCRAITSSCKVICGKVRQ